MNPLVIPWLYTGAGIIVFVIALFLRKSAPAVSLIMLIGALLLVIAGTFVLQTVIHERQSIAPVEALALIE